MLPSCEVTCPSFADAGKVAFGVANGVCPHKSTTCYSVSTGLALRLARLLPWWAGLASTKVRLFADVDKHLAQKSAMKSAVSER
jgi:hypothetical protein